MTSPDEKLSNSKPSGSRTGGIRMFSDLNRGSDDFSDTESDSDDSQEHCDVDEESETLARDPPTKPHNVDEIFKKARRFGAVDGTPDDLCPSSSSRNFTGTGRLLSGETVPAAPQEPQDVHNISFWKNGFTVNDGPLRRLDDPENDCFLKSLKRFDCPRELEPADEKTEVHLNLIKENKNFPEPEKRHVAFQGVGKTLAGCSNTGPPEPTVASTPLNTAPSSSMALIVDETLPSTSIELRLADGTCMVGRFNHHHTIGDIRSFIEALRPQGPRTYKLQTMGFPPKQLTDVTQTIEQAGLDNSVVIQNSESAAEGMFYTFLWSD